MLTLLFFVSGGFMKTGGRPKKDLEEVKDVRVSIRLNQNDHEIAHDIMKKEDISMSEVIRNALNYYYWNKIV